MKITGREIIRLARTASTQNVLKDLLQKENLAEGTLVMTDEQTAGRGMAGNTWESEAGKNLLFSFVWMPEFLEVDQQFVLTKVVSLALRSVLAEIVKGPLVSIKWPNDLYIGDAKIAGILVENSIMGGRFRWMICGLGLNVNQEHFSKALPNPVSLLQVCKTPFDLNELLNACCDALDRYYLRIQDDIHALDEEYSQHLYRKDRLSLFEYQGQEIRACIRNVTKYGHLLIEDEQGSLHECDMKTLKFIIEKTN
jgi:BirA family biotin operon repressor/biotin-[acetyl-CoA-carboxylase] ligase